MTAVTIQTIPLDDRARRLPPTTLTYDPADPFAVTMRIGEGPEAIEWPLARDLLVKGMTEPARIGDVHIAPTLHRGIAVTLSPPGWAWTFYLDRRDVAGFLVLSDPLVPAETNNPDLDIELRLWLEGQDR